MDKCRANPILDNINEYKNCRANAPKVIKESKRKSWHQYVSKLNVKTPAKKVWEMIRKISSKQSNTTIHHLENNNGTKITERVDIANKLAQEISKGQRSKLGFFVPFNSQGHIGTGPQNCHLNPQR